MAAQTAGLAANGSAAYAGALRKPSDALAAEAPPPPVQLSTIGRQLGGPPFLSYDGHGEQASIAGVPAASVGSDADGHTLSMLTPAGSIAGAGANDHGGAAPFDWLSFPFGGEAMPLATQVAGGPGGSFTHPQAVDATRQLQRTASGRMTAPPHAASASWAAGLAPATAPAVTGAHAPVAGPAVGALTGPASAAFASGPGLRRRPSMEPHRAPQGGQPLSAPLTAAAVGVPAAAAPQPASSARYASLAGPQPSAPATALLTAAAAPGALARPSSHSSSALELPSAGFTSQPAHAPAVPAAAAAQPLKPARPSFVPALTVSAPPDSSAAGAGAIGVPALTRAPPHSTASVSLSAVSASVAPTPTSTVIDISALLAEAEVETGRVLSRQTLPAEAAAAAPSVQQAGPR